MLWSSLPRTLTVVPRWRLVSSQKWRRMESFLCLLHPFGLGSIRSPSSHRLSTSFKASFGVAASVTLSIRLMRLSVYRTSPDSFIFAIYYIFYLKDPLWLSILLALLSEGTQAPALTLNPFTLVSLLLPFSLSLLLELAQSSPSNYPSLFNESRFTVLTIYNLLSDPSLCHFWHLRQLVRALTRRSIQRQAVTSLFQLHTVCST